jgi:hypothetical protein
MKALQQKGFIPGYRKMSTENTRRLEKLETHVFARMLRAKVPAQYQTSFLYVFFFYSEGEHIQ